MNTYNSILTGTEMQQIYRHFPGRPGGDFSVLISTTPPIETQDLFAGTSISSLNAQPLEQEHKNINKRALQTMDFLTPSSFLKMRIVNTGKEVESRKSL